jgi:hypothetical protein
MSSRNERLALATLALALLAAAHAEVTPTATSDLGTDPAARFQLRCWQQGKLIIDEHDVALPADVKLEATRVRARDRGQRPVYVVEARSAVCFIRPMAAGVARSTLPFGPVR